MATKVLSDGTEVSVNGEFVNIDREGDFEAESIPISLWNELKQAIDNLLKDTIEEE